MKRVFGCIVFLLVVTEVPADPFWSEKPFSEWTREEAVEILEDSPWASLAELKVLARTTGGPPPVISDDPDCCAEVNPNEGSVVSSHERGLRHTPRLMEKSAADFRIWFLTAGPVRMAMARLGVLDGQLSPEEAEQSLEKKAFPGAVVIVLSALDPEDSQALNCTQVQMQEFCSVELKKSGRKVPLYQYVSPLQSGDPQAFFVFPRQIDGEEVFKLEEEEILFAIEFTGQARIEKTFKLEEMLVQGALEL